MRTQTNRRNIVPLEATSASIAGNIAERHAKILRIWEAQWSARKIAEHLDIKISTVGNVVHKNRRARNPCGRRPVNLQDAPIGVWQQLIIPELEQAADDVGAMNAVKRAFVFACLLRLKRYDDLTSFKGWCQQVTGYGVDEIAAFVERGIDGHLIVDGQPNDRAFRMAESEDGGGDIALTLFAAVFEGTYERTADDRYSLRSMPTLAEITRWEDDGGNWREDT